jgi:hypothetical protein
MVTVRLRPFGVSVGIQLCTNIVLVPLLYSIFPFHHWVSERVLTPYALAISMGCILILSKLLHLTKPWIVINTIFPLLIVASAELNDMPYLGYFFFALFLITVLMYLPTLTSGVPYFQSDDKVIDYLEAELSSQKNITLLDFGCGCGDVILPLAKHFPNHRFWGVELGLLPYLIGTVRSRSLENCRVTWGSMWKQPIDSVTHIYAFLSPEPMHALEAWLKDHGHRGLTLWSYQFPLPTMAPTRTITLAHGKELWEYIL